MMFSIRSFVLYAVGTSMCGGLLVLLCLPLCALLRRLRAPSKLLCLFGWRSGCGFCCRAASRYPSGSRAARPPFNRLAPWFRRSPCPRNSRAQALPGAAGSASPARQHV